MKYKRAISNSKSISSSESSYSIHYTHTAISGPAASSARRHSHSHSHSRRLKRPIALLAALSFLLATSACDAEDENAKWYWIGGGAAVAAIVAIVVLNGSDDGDSNSGNNDNENSNGDNGNGNGSNSDLPGAPTSLAASANGSSQINLTWQAPADDGGSAITGYQIEYRQGSGAWGDLAADTGDADTDYDHNGLTADTQYSYRVSAINANGSGPASNEATAATTSLAADPKPGVPTGLTATPGINQVTLSWSDPAFCGGGNTCTDGNHQHWLEYKLTSAADDDWGNGAVIAGNPHATTHTVPGLTGGMSYDFRLAVQLSDETDRGPWAEVSAQPQSPSSTFSYTCPKGMAAPGAASSQDTVKCSSCETGYALNSEMCEMDSDGDNMPDSIDPDDDNDGIADTGDAFPMDPCASVDSDGDGDPDTIIAPGDDDMDACVTASTLAEDSDDDNDGTADIDDVDDDNDGLIEIASRAELESMAHNLAGSSYKATDGANGDTTGAPTTEPTNCDDGDSGTTISLCGYELANDIDLDGFGSDNVTCDSSNKWTPIGGCGSDGTCGEADSNDDDPFTAIFEGNNNTISSLCIEGDTTDIDVLGLFGHLRGATVRNLAIAEIYMEASFTGGAILGSDAGLDNNRLGALVGYMSGDTAILNVAVTDSDVAVDLKGAATDDVQFAGGLVGWMDGGGITASFVAVDVAGGDGKDDFLGGLVGRMDGGGITASYATGAVDGGDGGNDSVGGLVGRMSGGSITASYATGAMDGGDGIQDFAGGLVGRMSGGSITASFAAGAVDGGEGVADQVGGLVGAQQSGGSFTASYGFGAVSGELAGQAGTAWPSGVTAATNLAGDSGDTTTYAGAAWSADVWDFGSDMQAPALLYVDGYTFDDGADNMIGTDDDMHSYSCAAASFPAALMVTCGDTLLPGPAGSPQDRP